MHARHVVVAGDAPATDLSHTDAIAWSCPHRTAGSAGSAALTLPSSVLPKVRRERDLRGAGISWCSS